LKCQRLVGSGRQMANRLPFASHISAFSRKASGSRLPFLSHSDTKGSWPSPVRHQEEICLVSGRPTGLALGAGMAKGCRAAHALRPEGRNLHARSARLLNAVAFCCEPPLQIK
jgi:hypothetical protein